MPRLVLGFVITCLATQICPAQDKKITLEALGGITMPIGSAKNEMTLGYNVIIGAGWTFTPAVAALMEFQYDHFGLTTATLKANNEPAGFARFWSFSASPRYYIGRNHRFGGYATAGAGIYGLETAFTDPSQIQTYCDSYYGAGCQSSSAPIVASNTSYKGGFDGGGGLTYSPAGNRFKLVTDVRYNRFLSHANNSFITVSIGFLY